MIVLLCGFKSVSALGSNPFLKHSANTRVTNIYIQVVPPKMYSLFECPLVVYILILFQVQITLKLRQHLPLFNVIIFNLSH